MYVIAFKLKKTVILPRAKFKVFCKIGINSTEIAEIFSNLCTFQNYEDEQVLSN
jgi:hypothetical protein